EMQEDGLALVVAVVGLQQEATRWQLPGKGVIASLACSGFDTQPRVPDHLDAAQPQGSIPACAQLSAMRRKGISCGLQPVVNVDGFQRGMQQACVAKFAPECQQDRGSEAATEGNQEAAGPLQSAAGLAPELMAQQRKLSWPLASHG